MMQNILFNVKGIQLEETTKEYIIEKLNKLDQFLKDVPAINVYISELKKNNTGYIEIEVEIAIQLSKAFIKVEENGTNINAIIDILIPVLLRKVKRYNNNKDRWLSSSEWKAKEIEKSLIVEEDWDEIDLNYQPAIKKKSITDVTPMHPAEAIERMELLGHNSFLFKNIETNNYAMLYRRDKGGYGLVQPKF